MDGMQSDTPRTRDASDAVGPAAVEVGPSAAWIFGSAATVGSLVFVAAGLFERLIYDIPTIGPAWGPSVLVASVCLWYTLAVTAAKRLRVDTDGVHLLSIARMRSRPWADISSVGIRSPRIPMVDGIVTFETVQGPMRTPWGINAGDAGAAGLLERIAPLIDGQHAGGVGA